MATMRAMIVPAAGAKLRFDERAVPAPGREEVRIRVQACGVCHSDALTVAGAPGLTYPRIPGHEVIGIIDALGDIARAEILKRGRPAGVAEPAGA